MKRPTIKLSKQVHRRRILHVIKSLGRGGAEMLLPETLRMHNQSEFEFFYLYFLPWKHQLVPRLEELGGKVTCLPSSNNFEILLRTGRLQQYVRENKIDLVHAHLPVAGIAARLVRKRTAVPVIYTEHNIQERYHRATRWLNKYTFNWQDLAIAVSNEVANSIARNIKPEIPLATVYNGVDTSSFVRDTAKGRVLRDQFAIPSNALVVGTVAVFRSQKRLEEWIKVFAEARKHHPNLYGVLVGDGPLFNQLKEARASLGLNQLLLMPGIQTDVRPWLSMMDIFMMTSEFEGLPVALLEAMSMECAVLATNAGGIGEVISDSNGIKVGVSSLELMPALLSKLIADANHRHQLGQRARQRVIEAFSLGSMVRQLESLYLSRFNQG